MHRVFLLVLVAVAWLGGVGAVGDVTEETDAAALESSLAAAERAFARAAIERDREAFVSFLTPGTVFATPHGNLRGPDAILEQWGAFFAPGGPSIKWEPDKVAVVEDGSVGMTSGPFWIEASTGDDGGTTRFTGTFFSVWRREPGGDWKIVLDTGTDAVPDDGADGGGDGS